MPDYAVVIPAFNEEAYLPDTLRCLREVMSSIDRDGEIIVVDNHSTDATAEVARAHGADRVVFEPHNQIARARNAGAESTEARFLIFVDADTRVSKELCEKALRMLESCEVAGGGAKVVMDGPVSPMVGWIVKQWERASKWFQYAAGSFFFCRRDAFEEVGGFEEGVYAGEEIWFARRLKRWARRKGMHFQVIQSPPVVTSNRKSSWFSSMDFVLQLAMIFFLPWTMRSRRFCQIWYARPADGSK
ncbi:MAG: glycosyltransferase [Verrucomicrobiota bacterium]